MDDQWKADALDGQRDRAERAEAELARLQGGLREALAGWDWYARKKFLEPESRGYAAGVIAARDWLRELLSGSVTVQSAPPTDDDVYSAPMEPAPSAEAFAAILDIANATNMMPNYPVVLVDDEFAPPTERTKMTETDGQLLARIGTDAAKWTDAFLERFPDGCNDWGTMVGWFANAIEAGKSASAPPTEPEGERDDCGHCKGQGPPTEPEPINPEPTFIGSFGGVGSWSPEPVAEQPDPTSSDLQVPLGVEVGEGAQPAPGAEPDDALTDTKHHDDGNNLSPAPPTEPEAEDVCPRGNHRRHHPLTCASAAMAGLLLPVAEQPEPEGPDICACEPHCQNRAEVTEFSPHMNNYCHDCTMHRCDAEGAHVR